MSKDNTMSKPTVRQVLHPFTNLSSDDVNTGLAPAHYPWVAGSILHVRVPSQQAGPYTIQNEIPNNTIQCIVNYTKYPVQFHTQGKTTLGSMPDKYASGHLVGSTVEIHIDAGSEKAKILLNGGSGQKPEKVDTQDWVKVNDYSALAKIIGPCEVYLKPQNSDSSHPTIDISHVQLEQGAVLVTGDAHGFDAVA